MAGFDQNQPDLDGGSGDTMDIGGGGVPGTPSGTSIGAGLPIGENGGVFGTTWFLLVPVQDIVSGRCYFGFFDVASFDDTKDGSFYAYRQEDIKPNRVPTVNRVRIQYRDLGLASITVTISITNDNQQVVSTSVGVQIGNAIATNAIMTRIVDIAMTGYRPQLSISRDAGKGPVSIVGVTMEGEVEDA